MKDKYLHNNTNFLVVDLEATCWEDKPFDDNIISKKASEIIEIGYALVDLSKKEIVESGSIIVSPNEKISKFCTDLTSITQEMVDQGVSFRVADYMLCNKGFYFLPWGSWTIYDPMLYTHEAERNRIYMPALSWWNHLDIKSLVQARLLQQNKMFNPMSFDNVLEKLGIKLEGRRHRGIDDAVATAKVLLEVI